MTEPVLPANGEPGTDAFMADGAATVTLAEMLGERAEATPDRAAINANGGQTLAYGEWFRRSNAVAHCLLAKGIGRGHRVALLFGGNDWIPYAIAYHGVVKTGAAAVHLNEHIPAGEVARRLVQCAVSCVVHGAGMVPPPRFDGLVAELAKLETGDESPPDVVVGPDDLSDILYTSGTTGAAKPVAATHGNLTFGRGRQVVASLGESEYLLGSLPLGLSSSMGMIAFPLESDSTLILTSPSDPERMAEIVAQYEVGTVMMTPLMAINVIDGRVHERHDMGSVHTVATASAPFPPPVAVRLREAMPNADLTMAYTSLEAAPAMVVHLFDPLRSLSLGRPAHGTELLVVDEHGGPVEQGQVGEIRLRCPAPARWYLHDEDLNREMRVDGWTVMGDLGYVGDDGALYLFDRKSDAIHTERGLVSTIAVEAAIYEHPAVREAAVIGVPRAAGDEAVAAVVVLTDPGARDHLRSFLDGRLAPHESPDRIVVVEELPRSLLGKVLKYRLRSSWSSLCPSQLLT